jgi:hypothetical protein
MYMTPAKYNYLPNNTYAIKTWMNLYLLNANIHFQANASEVATVTQNNQLWVNSAIGLERCPVLIAKCESDSKQAMLPTGVDIQSDETKWKDYWQTTLYGDGKYTFPTPGYELPAYWGEPTENKCYAVMCLNPNPSVKPTESANPGGVQDVFSHYQTSTAVNNYNTKMLSWDQNWFTPVTKQRAVGGRNYMSNAINQIPFGKQVSHDGQIKVAGTNVAPVTSSLHTSYKVDTTDYNYDDCLYKPNFAGKFPGGTAMGDAVFSTSRHPFYKC